MAHRTAGGVHAARVPADVGAAAPPACPAGGSCRRRKGMCFEASRTVGIKLSK